MAKTDLTGMDALELAAEIERGAISAQELVAAHLARIETREPVVGAWAQLDAQLVLQNARLLDVRRAAGAPAGALHGVPVGLKDIIDTVDFPTENGTVLDFGRCPARDAVVVRRLRAAGAVILGKTVTTELATLHPGKTSNPRDLGRTPGGSSSGSAAAVADRMVPLAVGTQTGGSVIRPAAFCGVVGFKPSRGMIPCDGILVQAPTLDQVGVLARSVMDAALITDVLSGARADYGGGLVDAVHVQPLPPPSFGFARTPIWDLADLETQHAFVDMADQLHGHIVEISLPPEFAPALDWHRQIAFFEIARSFEGYVRRGRDQLSDSLLEMIEEGRRCAERDYRDAIERIDALNAELAALFSRVDAIVTPAAPGPAPVGLSSTGRPDFCNVWSLLGLPAISLPLLSSVAGLPIGVQLVASLHDDARLLRAARWLERNLPLANC